MKNKSRNQRRSFMKKLTGTALFASTASGWLWGKSSNKELLQAPPTNYTANGNLQIAAIGMGIMGFKNCESALKVAGVRLVAACDLYDGRLKRTKEVFGEQVATTKDHREILDRKDVDAVIISTTDHWHDKIAVEAMDKGKAVYCEKPMVHKIEQGLSVIESQNRNKQILQVGSPHPSSIVFLKAKELYEAGEIGQLVLGETWNDRQSANGAWQYSIPRDASTDTVDWDRYLGDAPKVPFEPERFFRWRNYQDYGTGVSGDLFVHLFSGLHLILSSNGPNRIYTTGGLRYWKDGRDVPDVLIGCYDYPQTDKHPSFSLQMRVNFIDGGGGSSMTRLVGSEGVMIISGNSVKIKKSKMSSYPGYGGWDSFDTFDAKNRAEFETWYNKTYPAKPATLKAAGDLEFIAPNGYNSRDHHFQNFFNSIETNGPVLEDAAFGFRAAAPALASNRSYFENKVINWDPESMKIV